MPQRRFRNIIKSTLVILFLGAGLPKMYAGSVLLSHRISLNVQKQTIDKVLHQIEKKAKVLFMYNPQMFNIKQTITVHVENTSLQNVLQTIINNKELVFYEMGTYIVITNKHQAPSQTTVIPAFLSQNNDKSIDATNRLIIDTIHFYDTVKVTKILTQRNLIQDTIKIYDTIRTIIAKPNNTPVLPAVIKIENKALPSSWFMQASFAPLYGNLLKNSNWTGSSSVSAHIELGRNSNNLSVSIGLGSFVQHGSTKTSRSSLTVDSVLQKDTIHVMQKYKTGDYYYVNGSDTIHKILYDSTNIAVARQWYTKTNHEKVVESQVAYSIFWIVIPCKIVYQIPVSKKLNIGLGLSLSPAFAIKQYGQIYDPQQQKNVYLAHLGISSFNLFSSLECSFAYTISKMITISCSPLLQWSVRSLLQSSSYYVGTGVRLGITKRF